MAKQEIVRVGVAGLGRSGWNIHCKALEPMKRQYKIVAVFDPDGERRREAVDRFACAAHTKYEQLLADENVDLVINATPNKLHAPYTVDALKAGKDVVCEKPMATSLEDADRMIAAARRSGRLLTVFQQRRCQADFLQVRKIIESGVLGRIVHVRIAGHAFSRRWDWQTLKRHGGGQLNNNTPHFLDQGLVLLGDRKPRVFCVRDRALTLGDADDHVKIVLAAKGAPTVEIEITSACPFPQDTWLIMGTQGGLTGKMDQLRWKYFNPKKLPKREVDPRPTADRSYNKETLPLVEKKWTPPKNVTPAPTVFYRSLHKTLTEDAPLLVTPESVRRQMAILEECRKQSPV